jgi:hypothetical protein
MSTYGAICYFLCGTGAKGRASELLHRRSPTDLRLRRTYSVSPPTSAELLRRRVSHRLAAHLLSTTGDEFSHTDPHLRSILACLGLEGDFSI